MADPIAIVGIGGIFPDAPDLPTFWDNILAGKTASKTVPQDRWTLCPEDVLSTDIQPDRVYSQRACLIQNFTLDIKRLNLDDELAQLLPQLDVMNHLAIHAGHQAWDDAKMQSVDRARVGIIMGNIALPTDSVSRHAQQIIGPAYAATLSNVLGSKVSWQHTPTHALNRYVAGLPAGLLAQTLNLGGGAHTLDAACASSLYALKYACDQLLARRADAIIAGGLSRPDCLYTQMGFSQLHALSASGICAPFSDRADGLVVGEGAGMLILKRLEDALAHDDHIYALIRGIGLSNDITGNIMAPDVEGQGRALQSAYQQSGWQVTDVDHIECHGTGTPIGDHVELTSLKNLWPPEVAQTLKARQDNRCVIGSVKSNVGHLLTGAGAAGLIKTLLAIKHQTLPPTANFTAPHPKMDLNNSPFEVLTKPRDWQVKDNQPRKAAVSAFGFGGINAHVLLEEYQDRKTMIAPPEAPEAPQPPKTPEVSPQISEVPTQRQRKLPGPGVESDEPIAIVGMAGQFGPYENLNDLRRLFLGDQKQSPRPLTNTWGVKSANQLGHAIEKIALPLGRFRIPPTELQDMLPQQLLMLLAAADALKDAGIEQVQTPRLDMGVYIGIGLDMNTTNFHLRWELANQSKRWAAELGVAPSDVWLTQLRDAMNPPLTANRTMGSLGGIVASRIARAFKVGGPSFTISSEQTSALHALAQAVTSLRRGEIKTALVGSVEQGCDIRHVTANASDKPTCDGAGALILKRLSDARDDGDTVYAVIDQTSRNSVINSDDALSIDATKELGNAGPATAMASIIKATLCLHHSFDPQNKSYWLCDQARGARKCLIAAKSVEGNAASITLSQADVIREPCRFTADNSSAGLPPEISKKTFGAPGNFKTNVLTPRKTSGGGGGVAFVFPGAGNQFVDMGKDLCRAFPHVIEQQHLENDALKSQFAGGQFWDGTPIEKISHKDVIFGQVCLGSMVSDICQSLGIQPDAMIGYSLGETTSMFASRSWTARDQMLKRMNESPLFTSDLTGRCDAARQTWKLDEDEPVDWVVTVVPKSEQQVRETLDGYDRAYLLIINKPDECVIGGDRLQVRQAAQQMGVSWHPVHGVTTVHCEVAHCVREAYRQLHLLPTSPPQNITFYSGIAGKSYPVTRESVADSIVGQAMEPFDFSKVIEAAYADGIRVFIEMGPGQSCTRLIDRILGDREHFAVSVCRENQDNVATLLKVARTLAAGGHEVSLPVKKSVTPTPERQVIHVPASRGAFEILPPPFDLPVVELESRQINSDAQTSMSAAVEKPIVSNDVVSQMLAAQSAHVATQQTFLRVSQKLNDTMAKAIAMYNHALRGGVAQADMPAAIDRVKPVLDREQCMAFAIGSIAKVLGDRFAKVDTYPKRVRLPDEPLMLVDRILEIEGEPCSMTSGRVVTEHDIHPGAWYLDGGVIPTCIAVEAGQADLFLSGYLGIDFITQGKAVYRLLDAEVTFHQPLPGAGKTIRYDIHIDEFFRQENTYLFRFHFDATVDGQLFLTMHKGCAGFFSQAELDAGKGIVLTKFDTQPAAGKRVGGIKPLIPMNHEESYTSDQIDALRRGDLVGCFGDAFANLGLQRPKGLPGDSGESYRFAADSSSVGVPPGSFKTSVLTPRETSGKAGGSGGGGSGGGEMVLVHRILSLQPDGGRFGLGKIVGEADIHPDDWFLTCHFCDDQVMPGTLMYECSLHTLRVYLLRMGWVGEDAEFLYEPKRNIPGQLKCRGQVLATTRKVRYELSIKEIGYDENQTPYVIADAMMYGDGKPIVQMKNMSLQLTGLTKEKLEARWPPGSFKTSVLTPRGTSGAPGSFKTSVLTTRGTSGAPGSFKTSVLTTRGTSGAPGSFKTSVLTTRGASGGAGGSGGRSYRFTPRRGSSVGLGSVLFDNDSILAFAQGNPSEAFGDRYKIFDHDRKIARLPRPPYKFLDRIVHIENCKPWKLTAGGVIEAKYDVPAEQWYFAQDRQSCMPFAILLEVALQPCGWLAAYLGSALTHDQDLRFRNLGGEAVQLLPVTPDIGTLTTRIKITNVSQSGGMIIQHYDMRTYCDRGDVYKGTTYFGFFTHDALANQIGIRDAKVYEPTDRELIRTEPFKYPTAAPYPDDMMRMLDRVVVFDPKGGPKKLGFIRGEMDVNPDRWFFKAHFYQDPVCPGSLGLESFLQLLKVYAMDRWGGSESAAFECMALGMKHKWVYRGQIIPTDKTVTVQAVITSVDDATKTVTADGFLIVDERVIYQMIDFAIRMR